MKLNLRERGFLTALAREHNQTGCRSPAHDLLRQHVYPDAPTSGPGSLAFAYDAVPLFGMLLRNFSDLQTIHDFLHQPGSREVPEWPWKSADEYLHKLAEAREESARTNPSAASVR
jgi:hypothetical protein